MKKTDWFPGDVRPVHIGVYETEPRRNVKFYQFWNGNRWGYACRTPDDAADMAGIYSAHQRDKWRGLAEQPK